MIAYFIICLTALLCSTSAVDINVIPDGLSIGAATAAYQVEGGWNASGKGESIWDRLVHTHPDWITDGNNGDIADDSYHKYKEDIKALKDLGLQHYRFSISWTRVLPTGDITNVNQDGIDYYNALINELLDNNITPLVTMYHFDLPQALQDLGGWANPVIADYFEDYARLLYTEFGDRVKWWITLNEAYSFVRGYGSSVSAVTDAPAVNASGIGEYLAGHTALKAHAKAYHLYDEEFREKQQGKVSITINGLHAFPQTDSEEDKKAAEIVWETTEGWFAHPIFSEEGDYPALLKEIIGNQSKAEGRYRSRLPEFDESEINYIKGTYDFFGYNHYTSFLASASDEGFGYQLGINISWPVSSELWIYYVPEGLRDALNRISKKYNNPDIFITESGWPTATGTVDDPDRVKYINGYMAEMLKAVHVDNSSVIGYTVWSLIDNFEWSSGFSQKFGVYSVDFDDPERTRTPKESAHALANITSTRQIPEEYF